MIFKINILEYYRLKLLLFWSLADNIALLSEEIPRPIVCTHTTKCMYTECAFCLLPAEVCIQLLTKVAIYPGVLSTELIIVLHVAVYLS